MTLVVRDEEDIIEQNIRFHKAMGIDGFIVTSHKSKDYTNNILINLKQEGLVLDIIYKDTSEHQHHIWVDEMIKIAKKKYKADWIINADADEFYYSKFLNLKKSILMYEKSKANVLYVDSTFLFPDNRKDFLHCPYFVTKPFQNFEAKMLNINQQDKYKLFIGSQNCYKVFHTTKNYRKIYDGNHDIKMSNKVKLPFSDVTLYHFHIKNYEGYHKKVLRWIDSAYYMPEGVGEHMKRMIQLYKENKLKREYEEIYSDKMREFLIENGVVSIDKSVSNFLKYNNI